MTTIVSTTDLPGHIDLWMQSVKSKDEAEKLAAAYSTSWFYQSRLIHGAAYLFVLNSEREENKKVKA